MFFNTPAAAENAAAFIGVYRRVLRKALAEVRANAEQYAAEVADWYDNGDGRPVAEGGKGHTYPYCCHGMPLWTDYDCVCWQCEDYTPEFTEARWLAQDRFQRGIEAYTWAQTAPDWLREERDSALKKAVGLLT